MERSRHVRYTKIMIPPEPLQALINLIKAYKAQFLIVFTTSDCYLAQCYLYSYNLKLNQNEKLPNEAVLRNFLLAMTELHEEAEFLCS